MVSFQRKTMHLKNHDNLQLLAKKFTGHSPSALPKQENHANVILSPMKRNQRVV